MGWGEQQGTSERAAQTALRKIASEILELEAEHSPQWVSPEAQANGKNPIGCVLCFPQDGSWPCLSRMNVDVVLAELKKQGIIDE